MNQELSELFSRMADLMDIRGENTFKVLAFRKVARILKDMNADIRQAAEAGTLDEIEGIGKHSQKIIEEYLASGRSSDADELAASVPAGLVPLLGMEGMGPKTIALLWKERNITSADELKAALDAGSLAGVKGLGEKKLAGMRRGLDNLAKAGGRHGIGEVLPLAEQMRARLRELPGVLAVDIAGSLRRGRETIGDVDLLCAIKDESAGQPVVNQFVKLPGVDRVLGQGPVKASIVTATGVQVDLRLISQEHYGSALMYFTGSKEHSVKLRGLAQKKGMTLNEWGLYDLAQYDRAAKVTAQAPPIKSLASRTEASVYQKLGLPFVEPELREDRGEIEAALAGKLPKLITADDLRGELHSHTTASDGTASIQEMAQAAKELGYEFLAITDHSRSSAIANGLTAQRLLEHVAAIHRVGQSFKGITLLAGSEVDILADGRLDYEDAVLAELDIVIASPHSSLQQESGKATDRLLRAIEHRYVNVIGHPSGRMIGGRSGLSPQWDKLFAAAAKAGVAMEINAGWPRLDLDESNARAAKDAGVMLAINTDAHSTRGLAERQFGLMVARRAWLESRHVINCMKAGDLSAFLAKKC